MDPWTALTLSHQKADDLQREFARHRLAKRAAASARSRRKAARATTPHATSAHAVTTTAAHGAPVAAAVRH